MTYAAEQASLIGERPIADKPSPAWFGHPPGLAILFMTETWEKFSYYGMRALLVYYMVQGLGFTPAKASLVYGGYTALAYFTPIPGGYISDRYLGYRRAVIIGGAVMALGHFLMAFPALFYPALLTIAVGNGLFLPSLPSQVGRLYRDEDPRSRIAYNIYYVGMNVGAFLAPLVCGYLGERWGWHWGFAAAGVGMLTGLCIFVAGGRYLPAPAVCSALPPRGVRPPRKIGTLALVLVFVVLYRGAYEQMGNSVALWTLTIDRSLAGYVIPATWFQSLNPLLVFGLTPLAALRWRKLASHENMPGRIGSMAAGALVTAGGFLLLAVVAKHGDVGWPWLAIFVLLYTWGEIHILPAGLALFGEGTSGAYRATAVAIWYFAICLGSLLAGAVGGLYSALGPSAFFLVCAALALLSAFGLAVLHRFARR